MVQANAESNTDLFRALKGGSNNFGVVTRFDLSTFKQGRMWGGAVYFAVTAYGDLVQKFYDFASNPTPDPNAHLIAATGFSGQGEACVADIYYAKPVPTPASLEPFTTIQPQLFNTLREDSLLGLANEQASFSTDGDRQLYFTTTFRLNKQFMLDIHGLYNKTLEDIKPVPGLSLSLVFQPLTKHLLHQTASRGGNSLGLSPDNGPLVILLLNSVHSNKTDDSTIVEAVTGLLEDINRLAAERGVAERYRFMNYAFKGEKPIDGYGPENVRKLQAASEKYDQSGFFQERVPGGFKLPR